MPRIIDSWIPGFSPQARGKSLGAIMQARFIFPTGVGVNHYGFRYCKCSSSLPHGRGGVPFTIQEIDTIAQFSPQAWGYFFQIMKKIECDASSPQAWGCFPTILWQQMHAIIFPTGVGVFLTQREVADELGRLPHRRGGI